MRVAAIDIGSNSIHLVVAQVEADGRFHVLDRAKDMLLLGRHLDEGGLPLEAMDAGVRTLAAFRTLAERQGATRFIAVATSAVREAANGGDFVQRVKNEVGLRVKVIPGREEARLVFLGVQHAMDLRDAPVLVVDAGGGSVEFVLVDREEAVRFDSVKVGMARMTERFLRGDPPSKKRLDEINRCWEAELEAVLRRAAERNVRRVIATSGTMLNLIAVTGHLSGKLNDGNLHNFAVAAEEVDKVRRLVSRSTRAERAGIRGLDGKRVDQIVVGASLAHHLLSQLDAEELVACTWALREGVLLDFIARHRKGIEESERFPDPRRRSAARLARHVGGVGDHGPHVASLALQLYDDLQGSLQLPPEAREWLEYAALLHDVGHHIGHKDHHRHSYYLITNGELLGFRRDEIEIIAQTARYHRKATPKVRDVEFAALDKRERRLVRALGAILRVADGLDRSHYGVVREVKARKRGNRLRLSISTCGDDAELEIWEAGRRANLLAEILDLGIDIQVTSQEENQDARHSASASG
jgi:exopolyphosphatase/guanosine-5'-triphosphate,3'-diphosphate pyrophosphatase